MNNFRRFSDNTRRPSAIDGFIPRSTPHSHPKPKGHTRSSQGVSSHHGRVGNFATTEGFHNRLRPTAPQLTAPVSRQPKRDAEGKIKLTSPEIISPHHRLKKKRSIRKTLVKSLIALFIVGLLGGGYLFGKGYLKARQIFAGGGGALALDANVDPSKLRGEGDGRVNVLLIGKGGAGHEGADLTDTLLIASIDPIHKEAALLSIPRDLYVKSSQGYTKINSVYANAKYAVLGGRKIENQAEKAETAGLEAIDRVVEDHIGVPIHYHVMVDFMGFQRAIDEVGGVEINAEESLYEVMHINGKRYILNVKAGSQTMDGFKALAYARSRMTSTRGDFDRAERQRAILLALKDKVLSSSTFANPKKVSGLMDAFGDNMQSNLSLAELMRLYEIGKTIDSSKISSIGLADPPNNYVRTGMVNGQSVVIPRAGVNDYSEIKSYVRNTLKDGFIRQENANIMVLNGTSIGGMATGRANDLKSYGYNVSQVGDAPTKTYTHTVLVDLRGGKKKYTRRYLEQRFKTTAVGKLPEGITAGEADFVIILGQNEGNNY